ncbi:MAG: hypothetical protein GY711_07310 [bacterium]|nr:hypothetical protein [bacterium]
MIRHLLFSAALLMLVATEARGQTSPATQLRTGHWLAVRGRLDATGTFVASKAELIDPRDNEVLIGTVTSVAASGDDASLLGMRLSIGERTLFEQLHRTRLEGARVEVEGHYRGPTKFSAREIAPRGAGRDRLIGRVDALETAEGTTRVRLMRWDVVLPAELLHDREVASFARTAEPPWLNVRAESRDVGDDDDEVLETIRISDTVSIGGQLEWKRVDERELDLDENDDEDRVDDAFSAQARIAWRPSGRFHAIGRVRHRVLFRDDDEDGDSRDDKTRLSEAYAYLSDLTPGFDLQVGRQDFDDDREWLYDQNLDAVRAIFAGSNMRFELSASTTLSDGSPRDEATDNFMAYFSHGDEDRSLAAYVVDRRDDRDDRDYPIHFGLRALGEWLPHSDVWLEYSVLRGYTGDIDLDSYGVDAGAVWRPEAIDPVYLSFGYARGTGDDDPNDDDDGAFRQTGLQDNNGKFGGVTSFRYYGELVDPELSNLEILTFGIGTRIGRRRSLDLVAHRYRQDEPAPFLLDTDLERNPDGVHRDLGWGFDLIYGDRSFESWDFEVVLGAFDPGDAFPDDADMAYVGKFQVRFKF